MVRWRSVLLTKQMFVHVKLSWRHSRQSASHLPQSEVRISVRQNVSKDQLFSCLLFQPFNDECSNKIYQTKICFAHWVFKPWATGFKRNPLDQKTFTYLVRGSITVWLIAFASFSCFANAELTTDLLVWLYPILRKSDTSHFWKFAEPIVDGSLAIFHDASWEDVPKSMGFELRKGIRCRCRMQPS